VSKFVPLTRTASNRIGSRAERLRGNSMKPRISAKQSGREMKPQTPMHAYVRDHDAGRTEDAWKGSVAAVAVVAAAWSGDRSTRHHMVLRCDLRAHDYGAFLREALKKDSRNCGIRIAYRFYARPPRMHAPKTALDVSRGGNSQRSRLSPREIRGDGTTGCLSEPETLELRFKRAILSTVDGILRHTLRGSSVD